LQVNAEKCLWNGLFGERFGEDAGGVDIVGGRWMKLWIIRCCAAALE